MASTVTAPVVHFPLATAVCAVSVGVIEVAACVSSCDVLDPLNVIVPAVPDETYPSETIGVMLSALLTLAVMSPPELTVMLGFAVMPPVGVVALPACTDADALAP